MTKKVLRVQLPSVTGGCVPVLALTHIQVLHVLMVLLLPVTREDGEYLVVCDTLPVL